MLKKFILILCLIAPVAAIAQEKIAYVSAQELLFKMPEIKGIESQLATKGETLQKRIEAMQGEYQTKFDAYAIKLEKFQAKDGTVSESEIVDAQKELSQLQERMETNAQASQAEYEKYQQELMAPIGEKIRKAIKEVGDEQGFKYILDTGAILYTGTGAIDASKFVKTKVGIVD